MENIKGNLSTVIKFIVMTVAPTVAANEALTNNVVSLAVAVIGFVLAYWDARYPNTIVEDPDSVEDVA